MEEMPFQLFLVVILFGFTLSVGFAVFDRAKSDAEKVSCYKTVNNFFIKSQIVLNGAPGSREKIEFLIESRSKLKLSNEMINGSQHGIISTELPDGTNYLQVLPAPFENHRIYQAGEYVVSLVHKREGGADFIAVVD